ncbi:hypothetical protein, partial [Staphylococcus aureus]
YFSLESFVSYHLLLARFVHYSLVPLMHSLALGLHHLHAYSPLLLLFSHAVSFSDYLMHLSLLYQMLLFGSLC